MTAVDSSDPQQFPNQDLQLVSARGHGAALFTERDCGRDHDARVASSP